MGIMNGETLSQPRSLPRWWAWPTVSKPPMPLEKMTPQRFRFSFSRSSPASDIHSSAAARESWVKRSIFLVSRFPSRASRSRFFTSPASFTFISEAS